MAHSRDLTRSGASVSLSMSMDGEAVVVEGEIDADVGDRRLDGGVEQVVSC